MNDTKRAKTWVEVILMPVVIAVVGIMGTYLVTAQQHKAVEIRAATERKAAEIRADSDRQLKIIEIFMEKITSNDENERLFALNLTRTLDIDLSIKLLTAVIESSPKITESFRKLSENLTAQAIATKLAAAEGKNMFGGAILEGQWNLHYPGVPSGVPGNLGWLEFEVDGTDLKVHGHDWKGNVTFDGKQGYYNWKFVDGKSGRTNIYLNSSGILFGRVRGSGIDWTYWGIRKTRR
jgi:uncharacterized protein (UPF0333 family)